jgi:hypothetical protein
MRNSIERSRRRYSGAGEVARAIALVDDRRGDPEADKQEVQDEPAGAAVAVQEWVDLLEAGVKIGE